MLFLSRSCYFRRRQIVGIGRRLSPRFRNPNQLRRRERYHQNPPLKGVKIVDAD
jgi:hypothetical protein